MNLRLRLTALYALALAAGLSLFAGTVWFSMRASLYAALNANLADHSRSLAAFLEHELSGGHPYRLRTELSEFSQGLPAGITVEIVDPHGVRLFASRPAATRNRGRIENTVRIVGEPYRITVTGSLDSIDATLRQLRDLLLAWTPFVILIATVGGYWLSRRALRPVTTIIEAARTVSIENLSQRLEVPRTGDELQQLAETWNAVLERLEAAVSRLAQFTADASHELRTPLAIIRATAELAARRSRTPELYRAALQDVVAEADRMTQLVDDLLYLARCDAGEMADDDLDFAPVLADACASIAPLADAKSIRMTVDIRATPMRGNASALRRLALVMIDNAIKYTAEGGSVRVTLDGQVLAVEDTGAGIPPEAQPHIFERFFQADPSRSASGYGLGLAQARSIAARHGAAISVESTVGVGSRFEVRFPACQTWTNSLPRVIAIEEKIA
jgi:heavy metal sensor kinase